MSFFGLTYLGPQGPFEGLLPLHAFNATDVAAAYDVAAQRGPTISTSTFPAFVHALYHCPRGTNPPATIVDQVTAWFPDGTLPRAQFLAGMEALLEASEDAANNNSEMDAHACEYQSGLALRADKFKHTRMKRAPKEKHHEPLTDAQTFGWLKGTVVKTIPKKSCEETKYASAMIQSGVSYY
ncbi:hypothetical protein SPRG_09098 [Saprolegnia parasitica CBS 223.65]|uniref:Uncharacterized protein n=1 Tax=Saprolegnia parasitica (strain CBS 223.65) TaxID=695850 RepID=A0A067C3D3_SAPPC|nr:hypothetical protein SPRG_09098 [Saprolegnia parasitica CBS 223.65]KDO25269.1 hypothetical protein SPRG_09098 [Saprolegnia parasitica CBS 223.65]|eukprot:XP_012203929.1 hypothetical protein SPRG_09098 [Saprolegnia parasitica CBS 223.65]